MQIQILTKQCTVVWQVSFVTKTIIMLKCSTVVCVCMCVFVHPCVYVTVYIVSSYTLIF